MGDFWTGREGLEPDGGGSCLLACCLHDILGNPKIRYLLGRGEPSIFKTYLITSAAQPGAEHRLQGKGNAMEIWEGDVEVLTFLPRCIFIYSITHNFILPCDSVLGGTSGDEEILRKCWKTESSVYTTYVLRELSSSSHGCKTWVHITVLWGTYITGSYGHNFAGELIFSTDSGRERAHLGKKLQKEYKN